MEQSICLKCRHPECKAVPNSQWCAHCEDGVLCPMVGRDPLLTTAASRMAAQAVTATATKIGNKVIRKKCWCGGLMGHQGRHRKVKNQTALGKSPLMPTIVLNGEAPVPAAIAPIAQNRITLEVNECQLNDFILKLPLCEKAKMANAWLAGSI